MHLFLVDNNSKYKRAKGVNRNIVATITHNEYKDVLLNDISLRHLMNRIESKDHRIGTYEIHNNLLSRFDDKIYIKTIDMALS